jgi:hypothetical protein
MIDWIALIISNIFVGIGWAIGTAFIIYFLIKRYIIPNAHKWIKQIMDSLIQINVTNKALHGRNKHAL